MKALLLGLCLLAQDDPGRALDALLPKLASENLEERAAAAAELRKLCDADAKGLRKAMRERIASIPDEEVRAQLTTALAQMPPLALTIAVDGEAKAGKPVKFKVRIRNLTDDPVTVVGALLGSDSGSRAPYYTATPSGKEVLLTGRAAVNDIEEKHFVQLAPGEEFDPFGAGFEPHDNLQSWIAPAGKHTVAICCDFTPKDIMRWHRQYGLHRMSYPELQALLDKVPKVKLEAKVVVEVK